MFLTMFFLGIQNSTSFHHTPQPRDGARTFLREGQLQKKGSKYHAFTDLQFAATPKGAC